MPSRLAYCELPVADAKRAAAFYAAAFDWIFAEFGPSYAATTSGDTDIGLQADPAEQTAAALPVMPIARSSSSIAANAVSGATNKAVTTRSRDAM